MARNPGRKTCAAALALLVGTIVLAGCAAPYRTVTQAPSDRPSPPQRDDAWSSWDTKGPRDMRATLANYVKNRCLDFLDMFDVGVSGGKWARVQVDYGIGFFGFGAQDDQVWRLGQRSAVLNHEATTICALPFPVSMALYPAAWISDSQMTRVLAWGGVSDEREEPIWPDPAEQGATGNVERIRITVVERDTSTHEFKLSGVSFAVGAEVHCLVGVRLRLLPMEILDFLGGLAGLDLLGDDTKIYHP